MAVEAATRGDCQAKRDNRAGRGERMGGLRNLLGQVWLDPAIG